jgi:hypothetical protein
MKLFYCQAGEKKLDVTLFVGRFTFSRVSERRQNPSQAGLPDFS